MKKFIPLLCALVCALPALAQDKSTDAPKEFGFSFNVEYSPKTHVTEAHIGFQREIVGAKPVVFDETVAGKNGVMESDTLSFVTKAGAVLGTLASTFDETGHLKSQSLTEGTAPPRALNWFATATKSPLLTIEGSALTVTYTLRDGFLQGRILNVGAPSGASEIATDYGASGRREHDAIKGPQSKANFWYLYDENGLTSARADSAADNKPFEINITHNKDGNLAQMTAKTDGILSFRSTPIYDDKGEGVGNKMESFDNGILSSAVTIKDKSAVTETYKDGVLASRKTIITGEGNTMQSISNEEFDDNGKLTKRTEYNKDGTASAVTTYNADGSVKSTRNFDNGK